MTDGAASTVHPDATQLAGAAPRVLEVIGAAKSFGAVKALTDATFRISRGEVVGLIGHNGAGKSTLVNLLAGTVQCTAGEFLLDGQRVRAWSPHKAQRSGLRCIFQELSLCANLTAVENTRVTHPSLRGLRWKSRAVATIGRTLDDIFPDHEIPLHAPVARLPIGQRQMIEIARAFSETATKVRTVILDGPTSALGHEATGQLLAYIRRTARDSRACILITHRLDEILAVCDRVVVMKDGRIVSEVRNEGLTRDTAA